MKKFSSLSLGCIIMFASAFGLTHWLKTRAAQSPVQERRYEMYECKSKQCAPSLPLIITGVRNLGNEHFLRDLEIEVKNISTKPIYYILLRLSLPEITEDGKKYGFGMSYGNAKLLDINSLAGPLDVPIKPGETYVFKVPEAQWKGFDFYTAKAHLTETAIQKVLLRIDSISFGDGTGFVAGGVFYKSKSPKVISSTNKDNPAVFVKIGLVASIKNKAATPVLVLQNPATAII